MDKAAVAEATARLTAPGEPWETFMADVDGTEQRLFRHAPPNLRELYRQGLAFADAPCVIYQQERYSFQEVWQQAALTAMALQRTGVGKGDRVAIAMRNYPEWMFSYMAVTAVGAIAVAMNAWWSAEEMAYGLEHSGARLLIADSERVERAAAGGAPDGVEVVAVRTPGPLPAGVLDWDAWRAFASPADARMPEPEVEPGDDAMLLYTSGSTAHPKGVLTTHLSIIHAVLGWECAAAINAALVPPTPLDVQPGLLLTVPLFHVTGLNVHFLSSFRQGRKMVAMYKWDPALALDLLEAEQLTLFHGVPSMAWELINQPDYARRDLRHLRAIGGGGAPLPAEHARQVAERVPGGMAGNGYGMTETNGLGTNVAGPGLLEHPGTCGRPIPPMARVRIADPQGHPLPPGQTGEIWIRGAMNFRGYWRNPEATRETLVDGWVRTGDIGHMDAEDYVYITDRAKDMVLRGGENIGCPEVEAVLCEHPDVYECAVFGVPDERLGEALAAVVMRRPGSTATAAALQAHVAEHLARFKVPDHIWLRDSQLPRIASGKIFKRGIRDEAIRVLQGTGMS